MHGSIQMVARKKTIFECAKKAKHNFKNTSIPCLFIHTWGWINAEKTIELDLIWICECLKCTRKKPKEKKEEMEALNGWKIIRGKQQAVHIIWNNKCVWYSNKKAFSFLRLWRWRRRRRRNHCFCCTSSYIICITCTLLQFSQPNMFFSFDFVWKNSKFLYIIYSPFCIWFGLVGWVTGRSLLLLFVSFRFVLFLFNSYVCIASVCSMVFY